MGSTLIAASYGNDGVFAGIDDFSQFDGTRAKLDANLSRFPQSRVTFIEGNCWNANQSQVPGDIDVYFYDGSHHEEDQYKGITQFDCFLASRFALIVDDHSWEGPRRGTEMAIKDMGYKVDFDLKIEDGVNNFDGWWNGVRVVLARKA